MKFPLLCALVLTFAACGESNYIAESTKTETKTTTAAGPELKNGIKVKENGLKVSKAVLLRADGTELDGDNKVAVGEEILCRLFISGWTVVDGRVKPGATQAAQTADGTIVTDQPDLFAAVESASPEDAGVITINATVTESKDQVHDMTVTFRVWDKTSNADVTGEYSFHLK